MCEMKSVCVGERFALGSRDIYSMIPQEILLVAGIWSSFLNRLWNVAVAHLGSEQECL